MKQIELYGIDMLWLQTPPPVIILLIGNLTNVVVHRVLEKSVEEEILRKHYDKESLASLEVAKRYREQINPIQRALPEIDILKFLDFRTEFHI